MAAKGRSATVSTSNGNKPLKWRLLRILLISAFLLAFHLIYQIFAHGVNSNAMQFAFLIVLLGGGIPMLLLEFVPPAGEISVQLWKMGLTTWVIGRLLFGVFEIYGSEVAMVGVFTPVALALLFGSLILYLIQTKPWIKRNPQNH
jgi:hypothetical protein